MAIKKEKFRSYKLDEGKKKREIISVPLNKKERALLEKDKVALQQDKDATAIKQLMIIGRSVIHSTPEGVFHKIYLDNLRKNKVLGIVEVEEKTEEM